MAPIMRRTIRDNRDRGHKNRRRVDKCLEEQVAADIATDSIKTIVRVLAILRPASLVTTHLLGV